MDSHWEKSVPQSASSLSAWARQMQGETNTSRYGKKLPWSDMRSLQVRWEECIGVRFPTQHLFWLPSVSWPVSCSLAIRHPLKQTKGPKNHACSYIYMQTNWRLIKTITRYSKWTPAFTWVLLLWQNSIGWCNLCLFWAFFPPPKVMQSSC